MNSSLFQAGQIPQEDRIQRLTIGSVLMMLTISGMFDRVDWQGLVALLLQAELLLTGLAGWCPIYWCCRMRKRE